MKLSHADRILKVNHAGEHGAVNIYRGQRRPTVSAATEFVIWTGMKL